MSDLVPAGVCCRCKCAMALPSDLYTASRRDERISFFCAHGHEQHFTARESEADILRRERDRLLQQAARLEDEAKLERQRREAAQRSVSAMRGQVTRLQNRASAGVCPCCNRTFSALARHMATKHPQFRAEEITDSGAIVQ